MADIPGEQDLNGIDIDKLAKGFADEDSILKPLCAQTTTKAREMRWYSKTAGFLDSTDTTGITLSQIPTSAGSLPTVVAQSWTRNTSYVKNFKVESELIAEEDLRDNDVNILGTTIRDLVRAVANQVDIRIYSVLIEAAAATPTTPNPTNVNTTAATQDGWDDVATGNPILDLLIGNRKIRAQSYKLNNLVAYMNPVEEQNLLNYLITVKGSSVTDFASDRVVDGMLTRVVGNRIVVSQNATTDSVYQFIPGVSLTWRSFKPLSAVQITEPLIGTKIRVSEEGEAILTDPKSVHAITDTVT